MKCKFYHPERTNQSQLPVADELRAQRDRAKNFSPKPSLQDVHSYQTEHRYTSSTPPPLSMEEQSHRASPSEQFMYPRDSSSPRSQSNTSLHHCPSSDVDEAFSSMGSSMAGLYIHDIPSHHSYSSGVPSCNLSQDDYSLPRSYSGNTQRLSSCGGGYLPQQNPAYSQCRCCHQQARLSPQQQYVPAWSSCPPLLHHHFSEKQCYRQLSTTDPRMQGSLCDAKVRSQAKNPSTEQRKGLRSQLSTLFPQSTVEQVMNAHPHISDMAKLINLIQTYRTSHVSY